MPSRVCGWASIIFAFHHDFPGEVRIIDVVEESAGIG